MRKDIGVFRSIPKRPRRVLIASSHALFGQGLRSLLEKQQQGNVEIVGLVSNLEEAIQALEKEEPDLVIVDYDDRSLNRDEFLAHFVEGEKKLRVVLLSLQGSDNALIYDRRTLAASQIDEWFEEWTFSKEEPGGWQRSAVLRRKKALRSSSMRHLLIAGVLVAILTALLVAGLGQVRLLPVAASRQAQPIDFLFGLEFKVIAFLFSLIVVFMLYSILVFRRRRGDTSDAAHVTGSSRLEMLWTIVPLATVLYFAYLGGQTLAETQRADPHALEVNVIASQWSWRFEYPELGISSAELRLPVNKQVVLHLRSLDVIHSFWVPEFRVKQDALPGGEGFIRDLLITPTMTGEFKVRCAEMCGLQHAFMESPVIVVSQEEFDAWASQEAGLAADPVERGRNYAGQFGCLICHTVDGTASTGPTWKGLFGHQVTLSDGTQVVADEAYLGESILNPSARIVQGFQDLMPANIAAGMTDQQLADVIEFIKSLK